MSKDRLQELQNYSHKISANPRACADKPAYCSAWQAGTRIVRPALKLYVAHKKSHSLAADIDTLAFECAMQQAAPARELLRLQGCFTQVFCPVGHERCVG